MSAILFDLDGVLYQGNQAITGAAETIDWFKTHSIPHLFLTNTSSKPRSALVEKLAAFGIPTSTDQFLTPPLVTAQWLKQNTDGPIALFIPDATQAEFSNFDICTTPTGTISAVVIGDLSRLWDFNTLNQAFRLLMENPEAKLVALGMTRYWRAEDGLRLDAGPYVSALSYATGREPVVMGKPAKAFYQAALNILNVNNSDTVMVGDDIKGDIEAAQRAGLKTVLVRTGKFTPLDLDQGITPDTVIDSVADMVDWWTGHHP
jgi:HAD superfamily hydrolase (TIGR01458 family)